MIGYFIDIMAGTAIIFVLTFMCIAGEAENDFVRMLWATLWTIAISTFVVLFALLVGSIATTAIGL